MDWALRSRRRGDAIVEFALLAPMLVLILFGILELGRVVDAWVVVHNAAREGARAGVLIYGDGDAATGAQSATLAYLGSGLTGRTDIATTPTPSVQVTTDSVQVTAEVDVRLYTPLFATILGVNPIPVRATASMRRQ
ncbi:MAG TPA: TadE/TadG family type IV pilus assembly protein [Chloroflexota bacterium]|jgi:Flp pilus assembly protein TadG